MWRAFFFEVGNLLQCCSYKRNLLLTHGQYNKADYMMGERRKHKSFWNSEEDTKQFSGMRERDSPTGNGRHSRHDGKGYQEFSAPRSNTRLASTGHSAPMNQSYMDSRLDTREGKEVNGGKRYYKNISPRMDEMELHSYNQTHEYNYDHRHAQRYPGRGRSRSRSRSRNRVMTRSRSLSRSRGSKREKWRRSRSRSRSNDNTRTHLMSHSPIADFRHKSHGWSEKRRDFDKSSSQVCRHFALGRCSRGSPCRYSHTGRINRNDVDVIADHNHIPRHSYDRSSRLELRGDLSEPYRGENEQFSSRSRRDFPCKDFMTGKCRWGNTCRFSHHLGSNDFGRETRNALFDDINEHQPPRNGKPHCKFFAAGRCDQNNCKFSHMEANLNNQEGGFHIDTHISHDHQKWWNDLSRDDLTASDAVDTAGWGETTVIDTNRIVDVNNGRKEGNWGRSFENETKSSVIMEAIDDSLNKEKQPFFSGESGSYSRGNELITEDNMVNEQEQLLSNNSQLLHDDNIAVNVYGHGRPSLPVESSQQDHSTYLAPKIPQKPQGLVDFKLADSHVSNVQDELKDRSCPIPSLIAFSVPDLNQSGGHMFSENSSILNGTYREPKMVIRLNKLSSDINTEPSGPLNVTQMQKCQKIIEQSGMLEPKVSQFLPNLNSSELRPQVTNYALATIGQVQYPSSTQRMPSFLDVSVPMYLTDTTTFQHIVVSASTDLPNSVKDGSRNINIESKNDKTTRDVEKNSETPVVPSSSFPTHVEEADTTMVMLQESPKLTQKYAVTNPEVVIESNNVKESKGVEENKESKIPEGQVKNEERIADKDEKGMRMFKNALVEFVKEILKPTWKEGKMSRDVHKTVVKKVVDKVCSSIQADQIPRTQDRIEHYLSGSKPKIAKLVQAYVERCRKAES